MLRMQTCVFELVIWWYRFPLIYPFIYFPGGSDSKASAYNAGDPGSIPGSGRFPNNGPSSQGYGFSSGHVWMWELDCEESWAPKNWCFWTVVLEKTLESHLDCTEIHPINHKGNQSWIFIERIDAEAETSILWPPDVKNWVTEKDPMLGKIEGGSRSGGQRKTEEEMVGWHHHLDGHEFEQALGVGNEQECLGCSSPYGLRVGHNWAIELNKDIRLHVWLVNWATVEMNCRSVGWSSVCRD